MIARVGRSCRCASGAGGANGAGGAGGAGAAVDAGIRKNRINRGDYFSDFGKDPQPSPLDLLSGTVPNNRDQIFLASMELGNIIKPATMAATETKFTAPMPINAARSLNITSDVQHRTSLQRTFLPGEHLPQSSPSKTKRQPAAASILPQALQLQLQSLANTAIHRRITLPLPELPAVYNQPLLVGICVLRHARGVYLLLKCSYLSSMLMILPHSMLQHADHRFC